MKYYLALSLLITAGMAWADAPSPAKSGYEFVKEETRAMQDDEFQNPGFIAVEEGRGLFNSQPASGKSCGSCHGDDGAKLEAKNLARYPIYDKELGGIVRLDDRINVCREKQSGEKPFPAYSKELLALETFVRHLAIGEPVNVQTDGEMADLLKKGEDLYKIRFGLIDMSCAHCHDSYPGQFIRGQKISQGQGNGFPAYRLDTGEMANLDLRIKQCLVLMRAEPFAPDAEESKLLGAYIMSRSNGLKIETPALRY
ncbi:sulfur oxidation c-type cytochrome SoxA [Thiothrix winogradskyi]|uniref:SoxAX cytochrome complex subunit A n=1 Tax=Thiothrix winogradskyi TaxID=96472 RepID=A0ABY3ST43_9GAMM|nr:sulfur oxidation c-type cytochrome SoxA [Thiothrix winogradskyi]UJS22561.1 sulfur oxidation c-type cytochrome SoxA [Thiothrix winogradskyi]